MPYFLIIQLLLLFSYFLYLLLKSDDTVDQLFIQKKQQSETELNKIIHSMEKINGTEYGGIKKDVKQFFSKRRLSINQQDKIDQFVTFMYFDGFKMPFIAFKKADFILKTYYLLTLKGSFIFTQLVFLGGKQMEGERVSESEQNTAIFLSVFLIFIPALFWLVQLGIASLGLNLLCMIFPNKGSLQRALHTMDEMIKMMLYRRSYRRRLRRAYEYEDWGKYTQYFT